MSQQPSGWYDDPSSPDNLRYWDGVTWTKHTTPKKSPTASQSTIGLPQQQGQSGPQGGAATTPMPQGSGWQAPGQQGQQGRQGQPSGTSDQSSAFPEVPQAPAQYGQQFPQAPAAGYGSAPQASWMHNLSTTADGVPLASWGRRFAAWLIDGVILVVVSAILISVFVPGYTDAITRFVDLMSSGVTDQAQIQRAVEALAGPAQGAALVTWLWTSAYSILFWVTTAQTPGKMALKISVRRADRPGPLDIVTALKRRALSVLQIIPLVSAVWGLIFLLDGLWPLWDNKKQALHDKIGGTQVVMGKQPKKQPKNQP